MMNTEEDDYLLMSGIQHFSFCRRQWALAYMEMEWHENVRTAEGRVEHSRCHDEKAVEKKRKHSYPPWSACFFKTFAHGW